MVLDAEGTTRRVLRATNRFEEDPGRQNARERRFSAMDKHNNYFGVSFALHRPKLNAKELCRGIVDRSRRASYVGGAKSTGAVASDRLMFIKRGARLGNASRC